MFSFPKFCVEDSYTDRLSHRITKNGATISVPSENHNDIRPVLSSRQYQDLFWRCFLLRPDYLGNEFNSAC